VIVRSILERATDLDTAVEIVRSFERVGAWGMCISHSPSDRICYLEYDGDALQVEQDWEAVTTTNHCLLHPSLANVPDHSQWRRQRLVEMLGTNGKAGYTLAEARAALRDRFDLGRGRVTPHLTMNTVQRVDNQASIVLRPGLGEVWVTAGPLAGDDVDHYYRLSLDELFQSQGPSAHAPMPPAIPAAAHSDQEQAAVPEAANGAAERFVLRVAASPLDSATERLLAFHGPVLILGANPVALALGQRLEDMGAQVLQLPVSDNPDETLAELERLWTTLPAPHLYLLTACDQ